MPTPRKGYHIADGTRVPSVTTITGRFKESGALIDWAYRMGRDGKDYRSARDQAADAGTLAHSLIDGHIHGTQPVIVGDPETIRKATNAFNAYLSWQETNNFKIEWTERQLVSEAHKYGGTPDAFGIVNNVPVLIDWKTSNAVYSDYLLQLAAYAELIREVDGIEVQGFYLCRFAKEEGDFAVHYYPDLSEALEMFLLLRKAYELDKIIKKRAA